MDKEDLLKCLDNAIESIDIQRKTTFLSDYDEGVLEGARKALEELKNQIEIF